MCAHLRFQTDLQHQAGICCSAGAPTSASMSGTSTTSFKVTSRFGELRRCSYTYSYSLSFAYALPGSCAGEGCRSGSAGEVVGDFVHVESGDGRGEVC